MVARISVVGALFFAAVLARAEEQAPSTVAESPPKAAADAGPDLSSSGLPHNILNRLSQEQMYSLPSEPMLVGILVPSGFFATVVLIVWFALRARSRWHAERQQTLRIMVERGAEIPRELLVPPSQPRRNVDLRRGILSLSGGLGYCLFMGLLGLFEPDALRGLGVGLIPILIGVGYLVVWRIDQRNAQG